MNHIFAGAKAFDKVLCWDISKVKYAHDMFTGSKGRTDSTC